MNATKQSLNLTTIFKYASIAVFGYYEVLMANAKIETENGTKIQIEGTPEEIAKVMDLYKKGKEKEERPKEFKKFTKRTTSPTIADLIRERIAEGFFDKPHGLAELKAGLEEQGHFIPITTLSGCILGLIKNKELRRLKQNDRWCYARR